MLAVFTNILAYTVEWCLYALYFRLEYGWSGSWCGFAQMVGDLLGGCVLGLSTMACVQSSAKRCGRPTTESKGVWFLFRAPFNIGLLALCHGILHCMLAQPDFYVALLGQIFMGTVYVFFEQSLQEMLLLYAFDDPIKYRDYLLLHYLIFTAGCALGSPLAYGLYELSNFANAFYVTGLCCFLVGVFLLVYYFRRLSPTTMGIRGGFLLAERELVQRSVGATL